MVWFFIEARRGDWEGMKKAFLVGLFLLVFDLIVQNTGWIFGLWEVEGMFSIGVVPVEVMLIAFFGALGEFLLIKHGYFVYYKGWTSSHAFIAYFITWGILNFVRYRWLKKL